MIRFMQAAAHVDAGTPEPGFELIDEALEPGRHRRRARPAVPHRPRGSVACWSRSRTRPPRRRRTSGLRGGGERRRADAPAQGRRPTAGSRPTRTGRVGSRRCERSTRPSRRACDARPHGGGAAPRGLIGEVAPVRRDDLTRRAAASSVPPWPLRPPRRGCGGSQRASPGRPLVSLIGSRRRQLARTIPNGTRANRTHNRRGS